MKKQLLSTLIALSASVLLTACQAAESAAPVPETAPADSSETEVAEDPVRETDSPSGTQDEKLFFTVDITDNAAAEAGLVIGNTASPENYCGIIEIHLDTALAEKAAKEIQTGKTYLFTVEPMMTMSIPPQVTAVDFTAATDEEIEQLEEVRRTVSNYSECMESYQDMELEQIIQDANMNYAFWTQAEISEFTEFIAEKGYNDDFGIKCYVNTRENLNGSIAGISEN